MTTLAVAVLALLDEEITVTPTWKVVTYADLWFYSLLFLTLGGSLIAIFTLLRNNASHSIGTMRSAAAGRPNVPSGGRFNGPAVSGHW